MSDAKIRGSCLCGAIRYEAGPATGPMGHCHCETCRKAHGAAFSTTLRVPRASFRWLSGEEQLRSFESSPGKQRRFCGRCGSHLVAGWEDQDQLILRAGCIDGDPGARPAVHIWTSHKAAWYDIDAELPALAEGAPRRSGGASR